MLSGNCFIPIYRNLFRNDRPYAYIDFSSFFSYGSSEAGIANEKKKERKFLRGLGACPFENFESQD